MDRALAKQMAGKLAARFPSSRTPAATLAEWADALERLNPDLGESVVDRLSRDRDTPPPFKALLRAIMTEKNALRRKDPDDYDLRGLDSACEFCQQPVANGPDSASRYSPIHDRWYNAHLSCADAQPGTRAN